MLEDFDQTATAELPSDDEEQMFCSIHLGERDETIPVQPINGLEFPYEMREPSRNEKSADEQFEALSSLLKAPEEEDLGLQLHN